MFGVNGELHFAYDKGGGRPVGNSACGRRPGAIGRWSDDPEKVAKYSKCYECKRYAEGLASGKITAPMGLARRGP